MALALLVLFAVGGGLAAWATTGVIAVLVAGLCVVEYGVARREAEATRRREPEDAALERG